MENLHGEEKSRIVLQNVDLTSVNVCISKERNSAKGCNDHLTSNCNMTFKLENNSKEISQRQVLLSDMVSKTCDTEVFEVLHSLAGLEEIGCNKVKQKNNNNSIFVENTHENVNKKYPDNNAECKFPMHSDVTNVQTSIQDNKWSLPVAETKRAAWKRRRTISGDSRSSSITDEFGHDLIKSNRASVVDALLFEIYDRWHSFDSDTFTECSSTSDAFLGRTDSVRHQLEEEHGVKINKTFLETKEIKELKDMVSDMQRHITSLSARLVRQLKHKDRRLAKVQKHCDIVTAILQASSLKRRVDSKIRFSIDPLPGEDAFCQWKDAMRAVARLPLGIPAEFRKKVWLSLADNYLSTLRIDWNKTKRFAFNERSNPDDNKLGLQIVKDLHRTGCSGFSGHDNEEERALLKRVLLAYARWNKQVGYCQGFNVLAALILDVVERKEDDALKIMIYLIDHVLPTSYFTNNLRALSVDMAVFRDLLNIHVPDLAKHLDYLQKAARDDTTGANYEPPLTNVFTMQWFLTLFATCLPKDTALRVWDSVLLEGSEILLRTALAIWDKLKQRIKEVDSADEFYSTMGVLTQEMLDCVIIDADELIKTIYAMAQFPFPQLAELREKYTYNITPFSAAMSTGGQRSRRSGMTSIFSDDDDLEDEEMMESIGCFTGMFPMSGQSSPTRNKALSDSDRSSSSFDISKVSPGAYGVTPQQLDLASVYAERMSLDLYALKQQYRKVRQRQKQAHIILTAANARHQANINRSSKLVPKLNTVAPPIESPVAVNHLFLGRDMRKQMKSNGKNRAIVDAPKIAPLYGNTPVPVSYSTKANQIKNANKMKSSSTSRENYNRLSKANVDQLSDSLHIERTDSILSLDSEVSATSISDHTKSSGTINGSMSDVSTVCGDSELEDVFHKDPKLLPQHQHTDSSQKNINTTSDKDGKNISESLESHANNTEYEDIGNKKVKDVKGNSNNINNIGECDNVSKCDDDSDSSPSFSDSDKEEQQTGGKHSKTCISSTAGISIHKPPKLLQLSHQTSNENSEEGIVQSVNIVGNSEAPLNHIKLQSAETINKLTATSTTTLSNSDDNISSEKAKRPITHHHHIDTTSQNTNISPWSSPKHSTVGRNSEPKVFNPFPSHHVSKRRAENGIKLGLYSADNVPQLEVGMFKCGVPKPIGRAHINACLHRQYMEDVRQSTKASKR